MVGRWFGTERKSEIIDFIQIYNLKPSSLRGFFVIAELISKIGMD